MTCWESARSASTRRALAKLCRDLVLDPAEARRPCVLQRAHLAGDPAGPSDVVEELQRRAPLRPPRAPGRATQPEPCCVACWDEPSRRGPLAGLVRDAVYPPSRPTWLCHVQKLAILRRRWPGRRGGSVWVYEGTLKIEYQATALSEYSVTFQSDHKHIEEVKRSHHFETYFRSPQLHLWRLSETEWLLALKQPERKMRKARSAPHHEMVQLRFPDMDEMFGDQAL